MFYFHCTLSTYVYSHISVPKSCHYKGYSVKAYAVREALDKRTEKIVIYVIKRERNDIEYLLNYIGIFRMSGHFE